MRKSVLFLVLIFTGVISVFLPACELKHIPSGINFTATPTPTGNAMTPTWTPTIANTPGSGSVTPTWTPTATATGTVQVCAPTPITVPAGTAIMNYGQARAYVIRSQANWDSYVGKTGTTAPVDFSTQMILALNWGTEYCQPGNGLVVNYQITSTCALAGSVNVTAILGTTCTCGGSCVYTMGGNQVTAVVLPASTLTVSVSSVPDVVEN